MPQPKAKQSTNEPQSKKANGNSTSEHATAEGNAKPGIIVIEGTEKPLDCAVRRIGSGRATLARNDIYLLDVPTKRAKGNAKS